MLSANTACKQASSRITRHQHLNDLVTLALVSAGVPATKEPVDLICRDSKRLDGMSQIQWHSGKLWVRDVTVVGSTAELLPQLADEKSWWKWLPPGNVRSTVHGIPGLPIAVETLGQIMTRHMSSSKFSVAK